MPPSSKPRLLPARLQGPAELGSYRFADWVKDHPILSPFADPQYGDLRTLRFRRSRGSCPTPRPGCSRPRRAAAPRGREGRSGQGRCVLFAFPADNAWGDWAIHRLYLPLVHQLLGYLTNRLPETSPVRFASAGPGPASRRPESPSITGARWSATSIPPNPRLSGPPWPSCARPTGCPQANEERLTRGSGAETLAAGGERPDELWRTVAWALLVVLVAEMFVANRTYA